jgi:hypothetical protein
MKLLKLLVVGYIVAGLIGLALERAGVAQCPCEPDCWCKRPGLNVFRWVFPRCHHIAPHEERQES